MIERVLRPHPNGLATMLGRGTPRISGGGWFPLLNLVWLFWVFASPWIPRTVDPDVVLVTYATVPVFLWLYLRAWYGDRAHTRRFAAAIAILALVTAPLGTTISYTIYAGALLPYVLRARLALPTMGMFLTAFIAVSLLTGGRLIPVLGWALTTAAISSVNLFFSVNARRDAELRLSQQEVRRLAATAERERIGRDLHDLLGHTLSLIAMKSELADRLFDRDPDAARNEVKELRQIARDSLTEVRAAVTGFRATGLAAERVSAKVLLASGGVELIGDEVFPALPADVDATFALCLREAVTNVHRHAEASQVRMAIKTADGRIELEIRDDGRGGVDEKMPGNGLNGMRERLAALGGTLAVRSPRGGGTQLTLSVPSS
ncbi:sensor histidine kinase [Nevskia sp.]|uniref:sensor histidine kinase n=1 Tax=Nevskia sp. TaxID=1929292 RepID=UPI0025FF3A0A|nr:sensor histidine kinase [Nevskia sp.]